MGIFLLVVIVAAIVTVALAWSERGVLVADPAVELRDSGSVAETRLTGVPSTGVDAREAYRLVLLARHGP